MCTRLIADKGLQSRVRVQLCDYRDLPVGPGLRQDRLGRHDRTCRAGQPGRLFRARSTTLLAPGGLVLNHGITAASPQAGQLGAGIGDFIEKYIFPGGELLHVSHLLREGAAAGLEMLDTENLRPHYGAHLVGLVRRARVATRCRAGGAALQRQFAGPGRAGAARLPAVPGRQRHEFRARLAGAAPDAGRPAGRGRTVSTIRPAHSRRIRSRATTCTLEACGRRRGGPDTYHRPSSAHTMLYIFKSKAAGDLILLAGQWRAHPADHRQGAAAQGHHPAGTDAGRHRRPGKGDRTGRSAHPTRLPNPTAATTFPRPTG